MVLQIKHSETPPMVTYFWQTMSEPTTAPRAEYVESAERAGLRYVSDSGKGIRRRLVDERFVYEGPDGRRVTQDRTLERIRSLAIPPAWRDVWICPQATGHLQVTARDARGRKQYRYHPKYREIRDETKFDRMMEFSRVLPSVRSTVESHLGLRGLPREKALATVVWLLERTLIRVGNLEYARDNESYGLTTLEGRHAAVRGAMVRFLFQGKSGKEHAVSVEDRRLARIVQRCQTLPGEQLFHYVDDDGERRDVDSGDVNEYLRELAGPGVTAKDFRTWAGTMLAAAALREIGPAETERETKANVVQAVDLVAQRLGNTRAVCRRYYIHPAILSEYLQGRVVPAVKQRRRRQHEDRLRDDEIAVLRFIRQSQKR
jgi:DNA topoisomerase-1